MTKVHSGRYTAQMDGEFVVFIIGFRINKFLAVHKWIPVFKAMGPMIRELYTNPDLGFLSSEYFLNWRGVTLLQYWKSYDQLETYARGGLHLKAWKTFNQSIGTGGTVGIFHETYIVKPQQFESIYGNMPKFGLGRVSRHVPAVGRMGTSRRRLGGENEPAVAPPRNPNA